MNGNDCGFCHPVSSGVLYESLIGVWSMPRSLHGKTRDLYELSTAVRLYPHLRLHLTVVAHATRSPYCQRAQPLLDITPTFRMLYLELFMRYFTNFCPVLALTWHFAVRATPPTSLFLQERPCDFRHHRPSQRQDCKYPSHDHAASCRSVSCFCDV